MKKYLFIVLVLNRTLLCQYGNDNIKPYMTLGFILNTESIEMGLLLKPLDPKSYLIFSGGYAYFSGDDGSNGYESYTETMGTVNIFDDPSRGDFSIFNISGLGCYFYTSISKDNRMFLLHQVGIISYKESYYTKYYDPSEILGNNGKYYLERNEKDVNSTGLEFGSNLCFPLSKKKYPDISIYEKPSYFFGYIGGALSTIDTFIIRYGIGVKFF